MNQLLAAIFKFCTTNLLLMHLSLLSFTSLFKCVPKKGSLSKTTTLMFAIAEISVY